MRRVYEYYILFTKEIFINKVAIFWSFIFPLIFMLINNVSWFTEVPEYFFNTLSLFWSFIILITAINGVGISLFISRENGFLKVFSFVSGSSLPIIIGKVFSQFTFLLVNITFFTVIVSILFKLNIIQLVLISSIVCFILGIPVFMVMLWIPILPFRQESIVPAFTLFNFLLIFLATLEFKNPILSFIFTILNPAAISNNLFKYFYDLFNHESYLTVDQIYIFISIFLYLVIGFILAKRLPLRSKMQRG